MTCSSAALAMLFSSCVLSHAFAAAPESKGEYLWVSLPFEVTGLPTSTELQPVSCVVDLGDCARKAGLHGVVDERSLRLYPAGSKADVPVQFSPAFQPRLKAGQLLASTPKQVSYPAELAAGRDSDARVAGQLTFLSSSRGDHGRFRLEFGVRQTGSVVQVPYPPNNFRTFDETNAASRTRWFPQMQIRPQQPLDGKVDILDGTNLVAGYYTGPTVAEVLRDPATLRFRRPFIYPLNGPDGISLTEFGKPHDPTGSHAHHYSFWIAHASVNQQDFWSETGGAIAHKNFELLEDGPIFCRIVQRAAWMLNRTNLMEERRQLTFYRTLNDNSRLVDIDLEYTPGASQPVTLGKTTFGFLAARVAQSMSVFDGGGEILNANGIRNEQGVHLTHAEWLDQSGPSTPGPGAGFVSGIALLDHPSNPNHPTGWHCRNDGWAGASFNMDGPHTVVPGTPLVLHYRAVLHRGNAASAHIAQSFKTYSAQPLVTFGKPQSK